MTDLIRLRDQLAKLESPFHGILTEEDSIAIKQAVSLITDMIADSNAASAKVITATGIQPTKRMAPGTLLYQYPHTNAVLLAPQIGGNFYLPLEVIKPGVLSIANVKNMMWGVPKRDQRQLSASAFDALPVFPLSPKENYQEGWMECFNTNFYPEDAE